MVYRILVIALTIFYICIGQVLSSTLVDMISTHVNGNKGFNGTYRLQHDKFSGMDIEFLINQIYHVKLVILMLLLSALSLLSEKVLGFIGSVQNMTQDCRPYRSLIEGPSLRFFDKDPESAYRGDIFESVEFATSHLHRVFRFHLPVFILVYVFFQIERAEASRSVDMDIRASGGINLKKTMTT